MIHDRRFTESDVPAVRAYFGGLVTECKWRPTRYTPDNGGIRIVYRYRTAAGITVDEPATLFRWHGEHGALMRYELVTFYVRTPPPMLPAKLAHQVAGFLHWLVVGLARLNAEECDPFTTRTSRAREAWDLANDWLRELVTVHREDLP